jgi:hypothetical protein
MRSLTEIDGLLAADKSLYGNPDWIEDGSVAKLASPLVDLHGDIIGGLTLKLSAPIETMLQRGTAVLILDRHPIQRLSFMPDHSHGNKGKYPVPPELRLRVAPADRSRIYRWVDNRAWPTEDNMGAARLLETEPATLRDAFNLFLETCVISAYLPDPPHRPKLEF